MSVPLTDPDLPTPAPPVSRAASWSRLALLCALLGGGVLAVALVEPQRLLTEDSLGTPGVGTWVLFALGYAALSVLMVPRPVMGLAGGALFGTVAGSAVALTGTLLGAAATFALGRALGQRALRPLLRGKLLGAADRELSGHGFRSLLVLRLIPVLPFAGVNHAAAVSRMPWGPFLAATALGCLPANIAYAVAGARATDPVSPAFLTAVAFLVLSGPVAATVWRRMRARRIPGAAGSGAAEEGTPVPSGVVGAGPEATSSPPVRTDH
ncbi:TVP38/TMEM64 family protein [Streptomyces otsuchiensis]|uniref:TVP38/TMEM64 family protein n=1 Tax=Streptomyces otsuchiensis TaxID=2681388 RepID=UPI001D1322F2|nr:TVP38/TMEM64 family protein [Streptomyces otsuchiensis]